MADFNEIMKQAKEMQERMQKAQEELAQQVSQGESGAGLVKVSMNGRHDVTKVEISEELLKEDKAVVEDLLAAAVNDVVRKVEEKNKESIGAMTGGFKMPEGFKFPF